MTSGKSGSLFTASYVVLIVGMIALLVNYDAIPDPVPVHFDASGTADRWEPKTIRTVLALPLVGLVIVAFMHAITAPMNAAAKPAATTPVQDEERSLTVPFSEALADRIGYLVARLRSGMGILSLVLAVGVTSSALTSMFPALSGWTWVTFVFLLVGVLGASLTMVVQLMRALDKAKKLYPDDEALKERKALRLDRRDDLYRASFFYNNPGDPHQVVFSRQGESNIDFNYAHAPGRRFAVAAPVLAVLFVVFIIFTL